MILAASSVPSSLKQGLRHVVEKNKSPRSGRGEKPFLWNSRVQMENDSEVPAPITYVKDLTYTSSLSLK